MTVSAPASRPRHCGSVSPCRELPGLALTTASCSAIIAAKPPVYGPCKLLDIELEMVSRASMYCWHGLYTTMTAACWTGWGGSVDRLMGGSSQQHLWYR